MLVPFQFHRPSTTLQSVTHVYPEDGKRLMASIERVKICLHNLVLVIWIDGTRKACWYLKNKNFTLSCQLIINYHHCYVGWVSLAQSWHWLLNYFSQCKILLLQHSDRSRIYRAQCLWFIFLFVYNAIYWYCCLFYQERSLWCSCI